MYAHPNSLGGVSASVVPFCVFLFPVVRRWWLKSSLLLLLSLALVCVVYSGSRTAYVGCLAFVLGWFVVSRHKGRWITIAMIVAVAGLAVLPQQYKERFMSIGGEEAEGASQAARLEILNDAWQVFMANPGGVGVSSFTTVRRQMFGRVQDTHNLYLEVATNLGIQGLIVFLVFVWIVGKRLVDVFRVFQRTHDRLKAVIQERGAGSGLPRAAMKELDDLAFMAACARATAFFLFIRLVVGLFGMDLYEIYWWFAAGMSIALTEVGSVAVRRARALELRLNGEQAESGALGAA